MTEQIKNLLSGFSFEQVEYLKLTQPVSMAFYQNWLDEGLNAEMKYLEEHAKTKQNLQSLLPEAKSIITVTHSYFEHPQPSPSLSELSDFKIAKYAKGYDYHYWFKQKLESACEVLKNEFPNHDFICATDSMPILERDFSYQAGLGWFGKNTCLIHEKKGSFFLIGEIISSLDFTHEPITPHPDRCGKCTRCIEACPTEALTPQKLDASKCISYWTIESKTTPPLDLAQKFNGWFFGCDICQDVCPWNQKVFQTKKPIEPKSDRKKIVKQILEILNSSNKALEKKFKGTPLTRPRGFGLKRNALIVALNINAKEIISELKALDLGLKLNTFKNEIIVLLEK